MTPSYTKKTKTKRRRRSPSSSSSSSSSSRRIIEKKHLINSAAPVNEVEVEVEILDSGSSTPKGERFRIPEMTSCPPAPKKRRIRAAVSCSLRRKPVFFASPDIDLFFYLALRGVPYEC